MQAIFKPNEALLENLKLIVDKFEVFANQAAGETLLLYKKRIFNDGLGSNLRKIQKGYTNKRWIRKREGKGLQTVFVDLYFSGNLEESISIVRSGNEIRIIIEDDKNYIKIKGNEERTGREIKTFTKTEREKLGKTLKKLVEEEIGKLNQR